MVEGGGMSRSNYTVAADRTYLPMFPLQQTSPDSPLCLEQTGRSAFSLSKGSAEPTASQRISPEGCHVFYSIPEGDRN